METSFKYDLLLAAVTVIPAATVWIFTNRLYFGVALGSALFLAVEYGYPALQKGSLDLSPLVRFSTQMRDMVRTRAVKRA